MSQRTRSKFAAGDDDDHYQHNSQEEWRDWLDLPSELVGEIANRLLHYDVTEYIRLRSACKVWSNITTDPGVGGALSSLFRPRRWILLSNNTDSVCRRFLNLSTGACILINLPELSTHHLEGSTDGLLLLRDKWNDAVRLLNPLTRALTNLPPITAEFGFVHTIWTRRFLHNPNIFYVAISDETSPASVVLMMRGSPFLAYTKPDDGRWTIMSCELLGSLQNMSVSTLQGIIYLVTDEGNILQMKLHPKPQVVVMVMDQSLNNKHSKDVVSYLISADDHHRHQGMLVVRHYTTLKHLSDVERRNIKRRKKREVVRVQRSLSVRDRWQLIQVLEVDLARKTLIPVKDIGRNRALFVGQLACFSLSTDRFPSVPGNTVYIGTNGSSSSYFGAFYLGDMSIDPPFEFIIDDVRNEGSQRQRKLAPITRPCSIQEYLVCCAGIKGGIED